VDWWIKAVAFLYIYLTDNKYFRLLLIIPRAQPSLFDLLAIIAYNLSRFTDNYPVQLKGGEIMKISTKGRYALRMMLDLAEHQQDGFVALKDIAARQNISKKYLEQIVPILNKSNFLQANRGFQGGYRLVNAPREYTVGSILRLTEGNLTPVACLDFNPVGCERRDECITLPLWQGLSKVIADYLDNITLQDILDNYKARSIDNYSI